MVTRKTRIDEQKYLGIKSADLNDKLLLKSFAPYDAWNDQLWNDLPESLTNMESFNVFKNAIKGRALDEFLSH